MEWCTYADQYVIQGCADQTFTRLFRSGSTSDTVITFSGHSEAQKYYWRVQANNIAGSGPWSEVSDFTFAITDVKGEAGTPTEFLLSQNYPNPFNPTTQIEFALPQTAQTIIILYDLLGRTVQTLMNKELVAGYHDIGFDASKFQSGAYFYGIQSGGFYQTKKMLFLK